MRISWVVCSTKQSVCCSRAGVAVELEDRRAGEEEALGRGRDQRGEVGQGVGVAERAVGAVGGEDVDDGIDVVPGHADGVAGEQLLNLRDVGDLGLVHGAALSSVLSWRDQASCQELRRHDNSILRMRNCLYTLDRDSRRAVGGPSGTGGMLLQIFFPTQPSLGRVVLSNWYNSR